ncbi:MAG: crotonase/enoyl-CoA hydratase family protein [Acidimicrobiales bacterium]
MSDEATILTERRGHVLLITLNRPEAMNSVNMDLAKNLAVALDELDGDSDLRVGVLTGNGRGFSAGMDLKAFVSGGMPIVEGRGFAGITQRAADKPLIAAVEGFALAGGLEIALSCDLIVASEGAKLGVPEVGVGLFAGAGALLRLPKVLPYAKAMEMALTGKPITAQEANELGMVARVTAKGEALAAAMELAETIAKNAPLGVAASKRIIRDMSMLAPEEFWEAQNQLMGKIFVSKDAIEGATAFAEKRDPNWTGQ